MTVAKTSVWLGLIVLNTHTILFVFSSYFLLRSYYHKLSINGFFLHEQIQHAFSKCFLLKDLCHEKQWYGILFELFGKMATVRPRGTWPRATRTSQVHDFKKGSKIFEISDFGTRTLRYTILKTAQNFHCICNWIDAAIYSSAKEKY